VDANHWHACGAPPAIASSEAVDVSRVAASIRQCVFWKSWASVNRTRSTDTAAFAVDERCSDAAPWLNAAGAGLTAPRLKRLVIRVYVT